MALYLCAAGAVVFVVALVLFLVHQKDGKAFPYGVAAYIGLSLAAMSGLTLIRDMLGAASPSWLWLVPFPSYFGGAWVFLARSWNRR